MEDYSEKLEYSEEDIEKMKKALERITEDRKSCYYRFVRESGFVGGIALEGELEADEIDLI